MGTTIDRAGVTALHTQVLDQLARPGDWLGARMRRAAMETARGAHAPEGALPGAAVDVVRRVAEEPRGLTREWADERIAALGDAVYAELVAVTATLVAIDVYARAIGDPRPELHEPVAGEPARERPGDVGDVGAWIPMTEQKLLANVSRALSLVPRSNQTWRMLVNESYSRGPQMMEPTWDRALTRPQIELVAARISQLNQCFY
jgi:hypothetical protein